MNNPAPAGVELNTSSLALLKHFVLIQNMQIDTDTRQGKRKAGNSNTVYSNAKNANNMQAHLHIIISKDIYIYIYNLLCSYRLSMRGHDHDCRSCQKSGQLPDAPNQLARHMLQC